MLYLVMILNPSTGEPLLTHTVSDTGLIQEMLPPLLHTIRIYTQGLKDETRMITFQDKRLHIFSDNVIIAIMSDYWDDETQVSEIIHDLYTNFVNNYKDTLLRGTLHPAHFEDFKKSVEKYIIKYENVVKEQVTGYPKVYLSHRVTKSEIRVNEDIILSFYVYNNEATAIILKRIDDICGIETLQPVWSSHGFCTSSFLYFENVYVRPGEIAEIQLKLVARKRDMIRVKPTLTYIFQGLTIKQTFKEINIKIL